MPRDIAVVLPVTPWTRYSVNAIAATLDAYGDHSVYLLEKWFELDELIELLRRRHRLVVVGVSFNTIMLTDEQFLNWLLNITSHRYDNVVYVAGGPHASGDPLGTLLRLGFDIAVIGEGEEAFLELVDALSGEGNPCSVKGVFLQCGGEFVFTGRRPPVELDRYPPFPIWRRIAGPIEITRGCPYGCYYCQVSYIHGFSMRHRSIDNIVYYAEAMAKLGYRDLRFITPDGLGYGLAGRSRKPRIDLVEELLSTLYRRVVEPYGMRIFYGTFPSEFRPEHIDYDTASMLRRYVVNKSVIVGAQTGSNRLLKKINRGHSVEDVYNAVEALLKAGFRPEVDFIFGLPGETDEDRVETLKVIKDLVGIGARIHLHVFMPLPGSPFAREPPGSIPEWFRKEVYRIIGRGAAYGQWIRQEEIAWRIGLLREKGIILPRISYGKTIRR